MSLSDVKIRNAKTTEKQMKLFDGGGLCYYKLFLTDNADNSTIMTAKQTRRFP